LKFLAVLLAAGMLAFLGAIVCIIVSVQPGASGAPQQLATDNDSLSSEAARQPLSPGAAHGGAAAEAGPLGALHGPEDGGGDRGLGLALESSTFTGLRGGQTQQFTFSRMICTPIPADKCKPNAKSNEQQADDPFLYAGEDQGYLRSAADQLRQTMMLQKDQILRDQETISELTGKLGECETGLEERSVGGKGAVLWGPRRDTARMAGDQAPQSGSQSHTARAVEELEHAIHNLKERIEKLKVIIIIIIIIIIPDLVTRGNSTPASGTPWVQGDSLQWKVEDLEDQLQLKMSQLEKQRSTVLKETERNRHEIDQGMNSLHQRVTELEQGLSEYNLPEGYKLSFPVRTDYMYARVRRSIPELHSFSACLWVSSHSSSGIGTPFSYSVPGQANEIVLLQGVHNPVELLINDKVAQLPLQLTKSRWHHVCVTWTLRDGEWHAYQDGELRGRGDNLAAWHPIRAGGVLILGQEQDTLGGRFDATQALVGELAQFNLWDRVLTPSEVRSLAECQETSAGNVVPWDDRHIDVFGGAAKRPFESCQ
ncbi:NPTXR protein, partial [Polyodon spathula]|nr:NPTXR protein [Polyodon spathula]